MHRSPVLDYRLDALTRPSLETLLEHDRSLDGVARLDQNGEVVEQVGEIDAQAAAQRVRGKHAVIERIAASLGWGDVEQWSMSGSGVTTYVHRDGDGAVLAHGDGSRGAAETAARIESSLRRAPG